MDVIINSMHRGKLVLFSMLLPHPLVEGEKIFYIPPPINHKIYNAQEKKNKTTKGAEENAIEK